jgi:hypothetical protein
MIEGHNSAEAMARCLISYIPDDARVRREVYASWGHDISVTRIREMRRVRAVQEALRKRQHYSKFNAAAWDWQGTENAAIMARASDRFVKAIVRERRA